MIKKVHPMNNDEMEGTVAELPWEKLRNALENRFQLNGDEEITEVKPTSNGLRVRIEKC